MRITIYVEGGGRTALKRACIRAFRNFFEKAGIDSKMLSVIPCKSRGDTLKAFRIALQDVGSSELSLLLVDSECPVRPEHLESPWHHLEAIHGPDRLVRPRGASDDQAYLMVQCMESWFLGDRDWLEQFFGREFQGGSLPAGEIEHVEKARVVEILRNASRHCSKGRYDKGRHSFDILDGLDPTKVERASPHAKRLFEALRAKGGGR